MTSSTRGLANIELKVTALQKPVHSGIGCLVPDPAQALASLINSLKEPESIPGLMEGIEPLSLEEQEILNKSSQTSESYAEEMGLVSGAQLRGDPKDSIYKRILKEPSITIINMTCGKQNGGNSVQDTARCTIGIRVLPGQDPKRVAEAVIKHLKSQSVKYNLPIEATTGEHSGSWAWKANLAGPYSLKYLEALGENFNNSCAMPCGGALPLLRQFQQAFPKMEMLIPGVEDPKTAAHSHNESQDKGLLERSINTLIGFLNKSRGV